MTVTDILNSVKFVVNLDGHQSAVAVTIYRVKHRRDAYR